MPIGHLEQILDPLGGSFFRRYNKGVLDLDVGDYNGSPSSSKWGRLVLHQPHGGAHQKWSRYFNRIRSYHGKNIFVAAQNGPSWSSRNRKFKAGTVVGAADYKWWYANRYDFQFKRV